jgi:hypothetical protein
MGAKSKHTHTCILWRDLLMQTTMMMSYFNFSIYNTSHLAVFAYLIQSSSTKPERLDLVHPQTLNANLYTVILGQTPSEKKNPENIQESAKQKEKNQKGHDRT